MPASSPPPRTFPSARSPARRPPSSPDPASGPKSLPTDLQALILERSGGNPLFAEELVRLLEDRGLLESRGGRVALKEGAEVPLPDSIGALIAARLDLLSCRAQGPARRRGRRGPHLLGRRRRRGERT